MVLVAIPYHRNKRYALDHVLAWVDSADLPEQSEVLIRFHRGEFGEPGAVKQQREFFRQVAIDRGASHLFFMGADTISPPDSVKRLMSHNIKNGWDVISGIYYGRTEGLSNPVPGMDCILLSRAAFTAFSFLDWEIPDDDYPAFAALEAKGFKHHFAEDVVCRHYEDANTFY